MFSLCAGSLASPSVVGLEFIYSQRGRPLLVVNNYLFRKNRGSYWRCIRCTKFRCKCRLILRAGDTPLVVDQHSHGPETEKIQYGRKVKSTMSTAQYEALVAQTDGGGTDKLERAAATVARSDDDAGAEAEDERNAGVLANGLSVNPDDLRAVNLWMRMPHFATDELEEEELEEGEEEDGAEEEIVEQNVCEPDKFVGVDGLLSVVGVRATKGGRLKEDRPDN